MNDSWRLPTEWEYESSILIAWPHGDTDWAYMLDEAQQCIADIIKAILPYNRVIVTAPDIDEAKKILTIDSENLLFFQCDTNDTWTRDYGPITLQSHKGEYMPIDFRFNGWGLKFAANYDNRVCRQMLSKGFITTPMIDRQDLVLEGGGIESDGAGTLMTTSYCQLSPNRNPYLSREEIADELKRQLGATNLLWIDYGFLEGDDTDSHIDTLARFAPGNTIVYVGCDDANDCHYNELSKMEAQICQFVNSQGNPYNLIKLPLPDPIFDEDGTRLPATYANFLATDKAVFMPTYAQTAKDKLAKQMLEIVFDVPVVAVDCRALIKQHGSLHCTTMQIPNKILAI